MKVYTLPEELPAPTPDYMNYDHKKESAREEEHLGQLRDWLASKGYDGERSGDVIRFPVGDGYAQYMMANGPKAFLIHLPYGDAYKYPDVQFLPVGEVLRRMESDERLQQVFEAARAPGM